MASRPPRPPRPTRPLLVLGAALACAVLAAALLAPRLAPHDPLAPLPGGLGPLGQPQPPAPGRLLGTDSRGRDVWSRVLHGARLSVAVACGAVALSTLLGLLVGVSAGYLGGHAEGALMRLTDVVMAFPPVLLAVALAAVLPRRGLLAMIAVLGAINWATAARIFRAETLSLRQRLYVEAARALGASHTRILARHILPHLAPTILVVASLGAATVILLDAGLAFLGVGLPPPAPTWGSMLQEAQTWYAVAPWLAVAPGAAILLTVAAFNLLAFELRRSPLSGAR
jgi:peptide/nickel transport system permease protein